MPKAPVPDADLVRLLEFIIPTNVSRKVSSTVPVVVDIGGRSVEAKILRPFEHRTARAYIDGPYWCVSFDLPMEYPNHYQIGGKSRTLIQKIIFDGDERGFVMDMTYAKMLM